MLFHLKTVKFDLGRVMLHWLSRAQYSIPTDTSVLGGLNFMLENLKCMLDHSPLLLSVAVKIREAMLRPYFTSYVEENRVKRTVVGAFPLFKILRSLMAALPKAPSCILW